MIDRPSIVLLPGIRGDAREFMHLAPLLPGPVLSLNLPTGPHHHFSEFAAALAPYLPQTPFHVVGASWGGLLGWALSLQRPLLSLSLIGCLPAPNRAIWKAGLLGRLIPLLPQAFYQRLYGRLRSSPADQPQIPLPAQSVLSQRLRAISAWGLPPQPACPSFWLWGQDDPFVTWSLSELEARGLKAQVLPGGHFPHFSHPEAVAAVLPCSGTC